MILICPDLMDKPLSQSIVNSMVKPLLSCGPVAMNRYEVIPQLKTIKTFQDWVDVWTKMADYASKQEQYLHAAYYYTMASSFCALDLSLQSSLYESALEDFYRAFDSFHYKYEMITVPYKHSFLNCIYFKAAEEKCKIIILCEMDSFSECYVVSFEPLVKQGYSLYFLDLPGQGGTPERGLYADLRPEDAVSALLTTKHIDECCIIGVQGGSMAATCCCTTDKRVKQLILYNPVYSKSEFLAGYISPEQRKKYIFFTKLPLQCHLNMLMKQLIKTNVIISVISSSLFRSFHADDHKELMNIVSKMTIKGKSEYITQDVLMISQNSSNSILQEHFERQKKEIINAKSLKCISIDSKDQNDYDVDKYGYMQKSVEYIQQWLDSLFTPSSTL
ncbi:hypothetical protein WA158_000514 [Blastocystis sp. Blastoise]